MIISFYKSKVKHLLDFSTEFMYNDSTMLYEDLYKLVAKKSGVSWQEVKAVFRAYSIIVQDDLLEKRRVPLPHLGKFGVKRRQAIKGRNPKTKEPCFIPAAYKVCFQVSAPVMHLIKDSPILSIL